MASKTFVDGETVVDSAWLQDVNDAIYNPGTITAADIANVASGSIAATDVQTAINELDTEKQPKDATLTALSGVLTAANKIPYATNTDTAGELDFNPNTTLANSTTTVSSNTVVKAAIDNLVVNCSSATPDKSADYFVFEDATDSTQKKALLSTISPAANIVAWAVFNGTTTGTNAPTAGYNVTSVTRNGTGDYTINFTNAISDANYAVSGTTDLNDESTGGSASITVLQPKSVATKLSSSIQMRAKLMRPDTSLFTDPAFCSVIITR